MHLLNSIVFCFIYIADSSPKCNSSEFDLCIEEHLVRCFVSQHFSRSMIESVHNEVNLLMRDCVKLSALGNVLPHQPIGIFI